MKGAAAYFIKTGRAIDESGPIVFKAIEDDQLYIITHEHYDKYIQLRCEKMLAREQLSTTPQGEFTISAYDKIGKGAVLENQVVDKYATIQDGTKVVTPETTPGYIKYRDRL